MFSFRSGWGEIPHPSYGKVLCFPQLHVYELSDYSLQFWSWWRFFLSVSSILADNEKKELDYHENMIGISVKFPSSFWFFSFARLISNSIRVAPENWKWFVCLAFSGSEFWLENFCQIIFDSYWKCHPNLINFSNWTNKDEENSTWIPLNNFLIKLINYECSLNSN